ncbi:hypothetical protein CCHL11_08328 [Colletotrichum chlorophyti]|uniref:Uncharacterized protein n=1 Tax=Colletotrichum chlorophyti TaxID=708187 RepID=A0A1Q8RZU1_9PEZI|nr:hypothetical protein CCHL11_08328 [Colletotrichum chlorophyti]
MNSTVPDRGAPPNPNPNPQAQDGPTGGPLMPLGPPDPANGPFLGGVPTKNLDLPVTLMFMLMFMLGFYIHLTIFRRNSKRGHKFLISDLVVDFCAIRTVTCIFRIVWSTMTTRYIVFFAVLFENSGPSLLYAVNMFFAQRLVRSIHPRVGWFPAFSQITFVLLISVPVFLILNLVSVVLIFFSQGNPDRQKTGEDLLKFGSSWNTWLSVFPILIVSMALAVPGPKPERFGTGSQRVKVALLYFASLLLSTGQVVRMYTLFNPQLPGTDSTIFGKAVFYTTGFFFEITVVALYAIFRIDLRYHIPNGSSGPGDYSGDKNRGKYTVEEIEWLIGNMGVPHHIMRERKGPDDMEMVFTIFFATKHKGLEYKGNGGRPDSGDASEASLEAKDVAESEAALPERAKRVTRRQSIMEALNPPPRMARRPAAATVYPDTYAQMEAGPPRRPARASVYSDFETGRGFRGSLESRYYQYWSTPRPYGK